MVLFLFVFLVLGLALAIVPAAVLGFGVAVLSGQVPRGFRIPLLVLMAVGSSLVWLTVLGDSNVVRSGVMALSFLSTLGSGGVTLAVAAQWRRRPRVPAHGWYAWTLPADPR
ncbi:hypothetical protein [Kitasatospora camelliae]|uniref:Uncharacterized protein n=1 Tax=Kitasatospora camelliae TaxID=3156397 RepID=A0AAU8JPV4_9ACTN